MGGKAEGSGIVAKGMAKTDDVQMVLVAAQEYAKNVFWCLIVRNLDVHLNDCESVSTLYIMVLQPCGFFWIIELVE